MNTRYDFIRTFENPTKKKGAIITLYTLKVPRYRFTGRTPAKYLMWVTGPTQVERVKVIETSSSAWKASILTIVLTLHSFKYHLYDHVAILILGNWFYFIIPPPTLPSTSINRPILMTPSET